MITADKIVVVCREIEQMLLDKNASYGDSVSDPLRVFSKADTMEAIRVRIDDKLSRIARGTGYPGDNDVRDLIGYLMLYLVNDGAGSASPVEGAQYSDRENDTWVVQPDGRLRLMGGGTPRMWDWVVSLYGPLVEV